jgi:hypothetical protein
MKLILVGLALALSRPFVVANEPLKGSVQSSTIPVAKAHETPSHDGTELSNRSPSWNGLWKQETNGWRVQLRLNSIIVPHKPLPRSFNPELLVECGGLGSSLKGDYFRSPNGKFIRFELRDAQGGVIPPKPGAGTNLLGRGLIYAAELPTWAQPSGGSLEAAFPRIISANLYPLEEELHTPRITRTNTPPHLKEVASSTNRHTRRITDTMTSRISILGDLQPEVMSVLSLDDLYFIKSAGDFSLTVQPVLYRRMAQAASTMLERVDLPSVTMDMHLLPNVRHPE